MVVMFLILLGLFLTFAAFAIDLGNIYLWKLRLDKAARAGVLAGLGRRGLDGWKTSSQSPSYSASAATQATTDNLQAYINASSLKVDSNYLSASDQMTTTVRYNVPTFLVHRITNIVGYGFNSQPGQTPSGTISVTSSHTAEIKPINVVLAIDVSGSMLCPATGSCACRLTNNCDPDQSKLALMARGIKDFVEFFNPARDRIAVIPFNLAAQTLYSFVDAAGNPVTLQNSASRNPAITNANAWNFFANRLWPQINGDLRNMAGSNTNHCDALAEAINELEALSTQLTSTGQWQNRDRTQLQPFVVFFTDGAPNAMRGILPQQKQCRTYTQGNPSTYSGTPGDCGTQDMYHYGLEWVAPNPTGNPPTLQYRGPGPFVARSTDPNGVPTLFRLNITGNSVAPDGARVCGQHYSDPTQFESTIVNQAGGSRRIDATGCLPLAPGPTGSFSFSIPYTNVDGNGNTTGSFYRAGVNNVPISTASTTWQDPNWPPNFFISPSFPPGATYGVQKYDELPYYCAVEAADYLRTQFGATIFTIGLGPAAVHDAAGDSNSVRCNDPLQDADDHVGRKDFFLARLAFARQMFSDPAIPIEVPDHYWFKRNPQVARTVTSCQRNNLQQYHRYNYPGVVSPPSVSIGYTSAAGLTDGNTTYQDLRPPKPVWADGQAEAGATVRRRIDTQGEYFPTNDANAVPAIFAQIAKSILLRSTS